MIYSHGLPVEAGAQGDGRGPYGFGRPGHGSDPNASYGFSGARPPLMPSTLVGDNCLSKRCDSATVSVQDLQFEVSALQQENAQIRISAASMDGVIQLELVVPLESQEGHVESTLIQAQQCAVSFLEAVLMELKVKPLRLD